MLNRSLAKCLPEGCGKGSVASHLNQSIFHPLRDFLSHPGKQIRAKLVEAGAAFSGDVSEASMPSPGVAEAIEVLAEAVEYLHAASLIIDDIEDGGKRRRNRDAFHLVYGTPLSINAANWLYFLPFKMIQGLELKPQAKMDLFGVFQDTLFNAHLGQGIDLVTKPSLVPQADLPELCASSLRLKTGSLVALAVQSGAIAAGSDDAGRQAAFSFGQSFGTALQMFDDLSKNMFEDLGSQRLSWVWACAASELDSRNYAQFKQAVLLLPDRAPLLAFFESTGLLNTARSKASRYLSECYERLEPRVASLDMIVKLKKVIESSYE